MGKLAILDLSDSGRQIGEKLFILLNATQKSELREYIQEQMSPRHYRSPMIPYYYDLTGERIIRKQSLTEVSVGNIYFCLEQRILRVSDQKINLTSKEFDIFALLFLNPKQIYTYEMISDLLWNETDCVHSRKSISNHVSNIRKKLRITPNSPEYIINELNVGYKFDIS